MTSLPWLGWHHQEFPTTLHQQLSGRRLEFSEHGNSAREFTMRTANGRQRTFQLSLRTTNGLLPNDPNTLLSLPILMDPFQLDDSRFWNLSGRWSATCSSRIVTVTRLEHGCKPDNAPFNLWFPGDQEELFTSYQCRA